MPVNLSESTKTMYIIGNANVSDDMGKKVDSSDYVIRFNKMNNYNKNTGTKTNAWVLSSNKFLINQMIYSPGSIENKPVLSIREMVKVSENVYFSIPPFLPVTTSAKSRAFQRLVSEDKMERVNAVHNFVEHFKVGERAFRIIEFPVKYSQDLAPDLWPPRWTCPSNGYLVTRMFVDDPTYYRYKKYLIGFSWEGWSGHPWELEKLYIEKMEREGLIEVLV